MTLMTSFKGTQRVISFLRQMVEHGGFYRTADQTWIKMERIQFVGACNPPTDPGRKPLTHRYTYSIVLIHAHDDLYCVDFYVTFLLSMLTILGLIR